MLVQRCQAERFNEEPAIYGSEPSLCFYISASPHQTPRGPPIYQHVIMAVIPEV